MSDVSEQVARIARYITRHGLQMDVDNLTSDEKHRIIHDIRRLLRNGHSPQQLARAAKYGMAHVWPYNEDQPWDSRDLVKNITKAKSAVGKLERSGQIPTSARTLYRERRSQDSEDKEANA